MKQIDYGYSDDYAVLTSGKYRFYFGYEHTIDDEWCFVVFKNENKIYTIKESMMKSKFTDILREPRDFLLYGIGMYELLK